MPEKGVKCPLGDVTWAKCEKCRVSPKKVCHIPVPMLNTMRQHESITYSPSRLLACDRQFILERHYEFYTDIDHAYAALRGTVFHAGMDALSTGGVKEKRLVDGEFSGKPDVYWTETDKKGNTLITVHDYKTVSTLSPSMTEAVIPHQIQVNLYAYLIALTVPNPVVKELQIIYFDMKRVRIFSSMPGRYAIEKGERIELQEIKVKPWEWDERFIGKRIAERKQHDANFAATGELPKQLPRDEQWKCSRCAVHGICADYSARHGESMPGFSNAFATRSETQAVRGE